MTNEKPLTLEKLYANPEVSFCCGVAPGEPHGDCDHARCMWTGIQLIQCDGFLAATARQLAADGHQEMADELCYHMGIDIDHDCGTDVWRGWSALDEEAIRHNLFVYWGPDYGQRGWVSCDISHPGATPDLNSVACMKWDRETQQYGK